MGFQIVVNVPRKLTARTITKKQRELLDVAREREQVGWEKFKEIVKDVTGKELKASMNGITMGEADEIRKELKVRGWRGGIVI